MCVCVWGGDARYVCPVPSNPAVRSAARPPARGAALRLRRTAPNSRGALPTRSQHHQQQPVSVSPPHPAPLAPHLPLVHDGHAEGRQGVALHRVHGVQGLGVWGFGGLGPRRWVVGKLQGAQQMRSTGGPMAPRGAAAMQGACTGDAQAAMHCGCKVGKGNYIWTGAMSGGLGTRCPHAEPSGAKKVSPGPFWPHPTLPGCPPRTLPRTPPRPAAPRSPQTAFPLRTSRTTPWSPAP